MAIIFRSIKRKQKTARPESNSLMDLFKRPWFKKKTKLYLFLLILWKATSEIIISTLWFVQYTFFCKGFAWCVAHSLLDFDPPTEKLDIPIIWLNNWPLTQFKNFSVQNVNLTQFKNSQFKLVLFFTNSWLCTLGRRLAIIRVFLDHQRQDCTKNTQSLKSYAPRD